MRRTLLAVALAFAGCSSQQEDAAPSHPSWGPAVIADGSSVAEIPESHFGPKLGSESECLLAKGAWGAVGESSKPRCIVPTGDAEKTCDDHSQCRGLCLASWTAEVGAVARGQCAATYYQIGCHAWLYDGRVGRRVCLD